MKAAELLVRSLENEGVQLVFGLPGEETLEMMDALLDSRIRFIETRYEQAWFGGGQPLRPSLITALSFKIEGIALAA